VPVLRGRGRIQHLPTPDASEASRGRMGLYPFGRGAPDPRLTHLTGGCRCSDLQRAGRAPPSGGLPPGSSIRMSQRTRRRLRPTCHGRVCKRTAQTHQFALSPQHDGGSPCSRWMTSPRCPTAEWPASAAHVPIVAAACVHDDPRTPTMPRTDYHFDGDPAINSTRRHLERVLRAPSPRRRPWLAAILAGGAALTFWRVRPPSEKQRQARTSRTSSRR
jgi:hypothetical protein